MTQDFKTIQSVGRNGLLSQIKNYDSFKHNNTVLGIGDDAAVLTGENGQHTLLSSDSYVEGVHFDLTYTPFQHLGYKIISAAISDILAMNGTPTSILVNLAVPNRQSAQMIQDLYAGIYAAGKEYELEVVGGDLTANHANIVITVTVYGKVAEDLITYRSGASVGDAICVTGDLGSALAGLRILTREKKFWEEHGNENVQPDLGDYEFVVKRQLVPTARQDVIHALAEHKIVPSAMIDITQGLISEITELCNASKTGVYLYQAALPIAAETRAVADEMEEDVDRYALFGGEDLELMFTLPEKDVESLIEKFNDFVVIGRMVPEDEGMAMQTAEGEVLNFDDLS